MFDLFLSECQKWYDEPAHTFTEMRTRDNKKVRGDVFEEFCVKYLKHVRKLENGGGGERFIVDAILTLVCKSPLGHGKFYATT